MVYNAFQWKMEIQTIFLGSSITVDGDCSHEIERHMLLGRKTMRNLDNVLKNRDIILPTKVCIVKAMVFPVVMCDCESWTIKKAERWRTDAFKLWCLRRLLRVPWRTWRALVNPKDSKYWTFTGLILHTDWYWSWSSKTLATWCEEPTHWKRPWSWERLRPTGKLAAEEEIVRL